MHFKLLFFLYASLQASATHSIVPSKYDQIGPYGTGLQTPLPGITPSDFNDPSSNGFDVGSAGIPFAGNPFIPTGTSPAFDPSTGRPINPATGRSDNLPIDPSTGFPIDPVTGRPIDPVTGRPIDPVTGRPFNPVPGFPIDPATGFLIDPVTGLPINPNSGNPSDPSNGNPITGPPVRPETNPGTVPPQPGNGNSGGLSQRDSIILGVFGGLFLLILLLLLLGWCFSKRKKEKDSSKEDQENDFETANVEASSLADNENGPRGVNHWFTPFSMNHDKEGKELPHDIETANVGSEESSNQKNFSERISAWFSSMNSGGKSEILDPNDDSIANMGDFEAEKVNQSSSPTTIGSKKNLWGVLPLFSKKSDYTGEGPKEEIINNENSQSAKYKFFGKKSSSVDQEKLLNANDTGRNMIIPFPLFLKSKKKSSDESLHGTEILEQASKRISTTESTTTAEFPVEFLREEFASQSPENSNMVLDPNGKEIYVLPPMVRHSMVDGKNVENQVSPKDIIIGNIESKKVAVEAVTESVNEASISHQTMAYAENHSHLGSEKTENFNITVIEADSGPTVEPSEVSDNMALNVINSQTAENIIHISENQDSNLENIAGAVVVTETTTIVRQKSVKSTTNRNDEDSDDDDLDKWAPPAPTSHVVIRTYAPSERDEMTVAVGDLIGIEKTYNDGWAKAQNITQNRKRGILPLAVVTPLKSGPTQTVIKSAGGIWKTGGTTPEKGLNSDIINYRETSLKYQSESIVRQHRSEFHATETKRVAFDTDKNVLISDDGSSI